MQISSQINSVGLKKFRWRNKTSGTATGKILENRDVE
jgi:hypothetical protein